MKWPQGYRAVQFFTFPNFLKTRAVHLICKWAICKLLENLSENFFSSRAKLFHTIRARLSNDARNKLFVRKPCQKRGLTGARWHSRNNFLHFRWAGTTIMSFWERGSDRYLPNNSEKGWHLAKNQFQIVFMKPELEYSFVIPGTTWSSVVTGMCGWISR